MSDTIAEFTAFCSDLGLTPTQIIADGKIHRFSPAESRKRGKKPGWYILFDDEYPQGVVSDWRLGGQKHHWRSLRVIGRPARIDLREVMERRDRERREQNRLGITSARHRWESAQKLNGHSHPYLETKGVTSPVLRVEGSRILVPAFGPDKEIQTLQAIAANGDKRFHPGAPTDGAFLPLGPGLSRAKAGDKAYLCEGFSTGVTVQDATGSPVICAFNGRNMIAVAKWLAQTHPHLSWVVAGDDDWELPLYDPPLVNVGRDCADESAAILGGMSMIVPLNGKEGLSDYNDMASLYGIGAVTAYLVDGELPDDSEPDPADFAPTQWTPVDPTTIPPREWLFGDILARSFVSVLVAPPGVGKSIFTIEVAISLAMKMDLGPFKAHERTKVWLFNNEDPRLELDRRISAFLLAHDINPHDVAPNLFVDTGEERHLLVAKYDEDRNVMRMPVVDRMIAHINRHKIGLLIVDPFIETHGVNENDNGAISTVARMYREIAQKTGCAVWLVHHTRKTPAGAVASAPGDADAGRGASALGGVARFTATIFNMTDKEAKDLGVPDDERHLYIRFDDGKANLKLKTGEGIWWRKQSVSLNNARGFRPSDSMGVLEWADMTDARAIATERKRDSWEIIGHSLVAQMEPGEEITLGAAANMVEVAAKSVGFDSKRTLERFIQDALNRPQIVGAWRITYTQERRGNGLHWIRMDKAKSWE